MAAFVVGAAATAAVVAGAFNLSRKDIKKTAVPTKMGKAEVSDDPFYVADVEDAAPWDCLDKGDCDLRPKREDLGDMDAISEVRWTLNRDATQEINDPPQHTKRYSANPMEFGGQLSSDEMPRMTRAATDLQFWGPTDWEAERQMKNFPSYINNRAEELNGKEINRPKDQFGNQQFAGDSLFKEEGAMDVDFGDGQTSARTSEVRLMQRNRYGRFVTSRSAERPKFLPPTMTRSMGGQPGIEPDVTIGARLSKVFAGFLGERNGGAKAGSDFADTVLEKSRRLDYEPRTGLTHAAGGTHPSGPEVNPYEGYHYTTRERATEWDENTGGKSRMGKNGYLLLGNPELEYRSRKEPEDRAEYQQAGKAKSAYLLLGNPELEYRARKQPEDLQEYQPGRMGARGSLYGGEATHGIVIPNVKSSAVADRFLGRGGRNMLGGTGYITLRSNMKNGLKGGDCDNTPAPGLINLQTPRAVAIIGGRTKAALDDLFDVQHS